MNEHLAAAEDRFRVGPFVIDPHDRSLRRGRRQIPLDRRAFEVLLVLARQPGRTVAKEALIAEVWEGRAVTDDVVTKAIGAIRRRFADTPARSGCVRTVRGEGYRLLAPVRPCRRPRPVQRWLAGAAAAALAVAAFQALPRPRESRPSAAEAGNASEPGDPRAMHLEQLAPNLIALANAAERPAVSNAQPSWSPDGRSIVFVSNRDGPDKLFLARTDRPSVEALTTASMEPAEPVWSPDGASIAFSARQGANWDVFLLQPSGEIVRLTHDSAPDFQPVWTADGTGLVFASKRNGNIDLYLTDRDRTVTRNLTRHPARDAGAAISPDGTTLAFSSDRTADGTWAVFTMALAGGEPRQITFGTADCSSPQWSPNGSLLAFKRERLGDTDILALDLSDGSVRSLVRDARSVHEPSWSPDGRRVAFHVRGKQGRDIFIRDLARNVEIPLTAGRS